MKNADISLLFLNRDISILNTDIYISDPDICIKWARTQTYPL